MFNNLRKNNLLLLIILGVLLIIAYFLVSIDPQNVQLSVGENKFTINNPGNTDSIHLSNNEGSYTFINKGERWSINNRYLLDQRLQKLLLAVLNRVNVTRPASKLIQDSIVKKMQNKGAHIKIYRPDEPVKSFYITGNQEDQNTYFMEAETQKPFLVGIPGYNSYLASLFFLNRNQWRDKVIFGSSFRSLQNLELNYSKKYKQNNDLRDMVVVYKDDFFEIKGLGKPLDSAKLFNYLKNYQNFEANNYLEPSTSINLDSLKSVKPFVTISVTDIDSTLNNQLAVYDHSVNIMDNPMLPGEIIPENEWVLVPKEQVTSIIKPLEFFVREPGESGEVPLGRLPQQE